jgi:hypothetical protein
MCLHIRPGTWPQLGVGWRHAGSPQASSSPSTALCGPPPGTWPQLGVGWRHAGSPPASSSLTMHHRLHSAGLSLASDLACPYGSAHPPSLGAHLLLSFLPSPRTPPHSPSSTPHPILYLPFSISPHPSFQPTPCPPLGDPPPTSTHSWGPTPNQHTLTQTRPTGRPPLQQTANEKLGTWQGYWEG